MRFFASAFNADKAHGEQHRSRAVERSINTGQAVGESHELEKPEVQDQRNQQSRQIADGGNK